jgi:hypothetical protein
VVVSAGRGFKLGFASRFVRVISFTNGKGVESLVLTAGEQYEGVVLPDQVGKCDEGRLRDACIKLGIRRDVS